MIKRSIEESDQFLKDVEDAAVWILINNLEQSESLALKMLDKFQSELESFKEKLLSYPLMGEEDVVKGVRKFPIYNGRYSAKWIVLDKHRIIMLSFLDLKYPISLREFNLDED